MEETAAIPSVDVGDTATESAVAAAHSAASAESAASGAQLEAIHAADAAEATAAHADAIVEAVVSSEQEIVRAAEVHSEAAIAQALVTIEADLERENSWLGTELTGVKVTLAELKAMFPIAIPELLSTLQDRLLKIEANHLETMEFLRLSLSPSSSNPKAENHEDGEGENPVARIEQPPQPRKRKWLAV